MRWRLGLAAIFFLGTTLATSAQQGGVKVWVPFEFGVSNLTLPSGEYVVWSQQDELYLRAAGGKIVAMVSSNRVVHEGGKYGKVIFNCYEKRCFLSQLWMPDAERGHVLLESKSEKEAARKASPQQYALLAEEPEKRN